MSNSTVKVKPWDGVPGDFVVIDADQFDPDIHEKIEDPKPAAATKKPAAAK